MGNKLINKCQDLLGTKFRTPNGNRTHDFPDKGWNALALNRGRLVMSEDLHGEYINILFQCQSQISY